MRDSFIFYRSFYEAIKEIEDPVIRDQIYSSIFEFGLNEVEQNLTGMAKAMFLLIKPQLDANNKRYHNGTKGGRCAESSEPNANQTVTKGEPNANQTATKPEPNANDNVNENEDKKEETPLPPLARGDVCEPPVSEIPKPKPRGDIVKERFERFWNAYPRRVGKDAAFKAFQKKVTTAETLDDILKALKWQTECDDWLKEDGRFIPHPTTYLNQGRWHDEEQAECVDDYTAMMARIDAENEELSRQAKERKRLREEAMKAQGAANGL